MIIAIELAMPPIITPFDRHFAIIFDYRHFRIFATPIDRDASMITHIAAAISLPAGHYYASYFTMPD
jgi:hypothetical protein